MGVEIENVRFVTAQEVMDELGVSRQTLWRWRRAGKIPAGHRFRNGRVLYSDAEFEAIRRYANQLIPMDEATARQLELGLPDSMRDRTKT